MASVLRGLGLRVGHEGYYTVGPRDENLDVDVSWIALCSQDVRPISYFQARHPLKTIASLTERPAAPEYRAQLDQYIGPRGEDLLHDALRWTLALTQLGLATCEAWWRVEDVTPHDLWPLVQDLGHDCTLQDIHFALKDTSDSTNSHGTRRVVTWRDLAGYPEKWAMRELARDLGY